MKIEITKESNLGAIVNTWPDAAGIMLEYGLHCAGCFANQFDTVEQGAMIHGMSEEEITEMIARLNQLVTEQSDEKNS